VAVAAAAKPALHETLSWFTQNNASNSREKGAPLRFLAIT
jgi:hypothetical protein